MNRKSLYFTDETETAIKTTPLTPEADEVVVETRVSAISAGTEMLVYRGDALSSSIRTVAEVIAPLPSIGGWVYLIGGLVGTLLISTVR